MHWVTDPTVTLSDTQACTNGQLSCCCGTTANPRRDHPRLCPSRSGIGPRGAVANSHPVTVVELLGSPAVLQDLDRSLTFHQSGVYDRLSGSLRGTQRVVRVQQLNRRVRGNWLPRTSRRTPFALLLPEMEVRMHQLAHALVHP